MLPIVSQPVINDNYIFKITINDYMKLPVGRQFGFVGSACVFLRSFELFLPVAHGITVCGQALNVPIIERVLLKF